MGFRQKSEPPEPCVLQFFKGGFLFWGFCLLFCPKYRETPQTKNGGYENGGLLTLEIDRHKSAFSKRAFHSNVPSHMVPIRFQTIFEGKGTVPGTISMHTLASTSQQEPCNTTYLRGRYQARFFGLIFGHS